MGKINSAIRCSKEFWEIVNFIRARYILNGKVPPKMSRITKIIARKINKEELLQDVLIEI